MRTVYLGTSNFAAAVLRELAATPHRPSLVITRPDRPRGRGRRMQSPPVALTAKDLGLELIAPEKLHDQEVLDQIAAAKPDFLCVCAYGVLIKAPLLDKYELLNVHPSLLPRWRGAAPLERAIMAGDSHTGVSIMRIGAGLDSGPVYMQTEVEIRGDDDFATLSSRLEPLSAQLLIKTIEEHPDPKAQDEDQVTYADKIEAQDRLLDSRRSASELERQVRALRPHVGARLALPDPIGYLGVWEAQVTDPASDEKATISCDGKRLIVNTAAGGLELLEVQPAGGKRMSVKDWLRGRPELAHSNLALAELTREAN